MMTPAPATVSAPTQTSTRQQQRGLLLMTASGNVVRTLMPLVISAEDLEKGLDILAAAAAELTRGGA